MRFDGLRFAVFDRGNTPLMTSASIRALLAGRDGSLWIGTDGGGLLRRTGTAVRVVTVPALPGRGGRRATGRPRERGRRRPRAGSRRAGPAACRDPAAGAALLGCPSPRPRGRALPLSPGGLRPGPDRHRDPPVRLLHEPAARRLSVPRERGDPLGRWGEEASYEFHLAPYFHQTAAFYAFLVAGAILGAAAAYRVRTAQLRAREALLRQRVDEAMANVKMLRGLLPICAWCKKVREDGGYWSQIEAYVAAHSQAEFSHSICPDCLQQAYPEIARRWAEGGKEG